MDDPHETITPAAEILVPATQEDRPVVLAPDTPLGSVGPQDSRGESVPNTPGVDDEPGRSTGTYVRALPDAINRAVFLTFLW